MTYPARITQVKHRSKRMAARTFAVITAREMAEVIAEAVSEYDTDHGFQILGSTLTDLKLMTVLTIQLNDGTYFNCMVERVTKNKKK
jgi:hypothetical protein